MNKEFHYLILHVLTIMPEHIPEDLVSIKTDEKNESINSENNDPITTKSSLSCLDPQDQ